MNGIVLKDVTDGKADQLQILKVVGCAYITNTC